SIKAISQAGPEAPIRAAIDRGKRWAENPAAVVYEDPVGALMDVSAVTGGASSLARATGVPALSRASDVASSVSEATNPLSVPARAVAKGTAAAKDLVTRQVARVGARSRNAELLANTVNPARVDTGSAGSDLQRAIVDRRTQVMRPLQDRYTKILGTDASPSRLGRARAVETLTPPPGSPAAMNVR